MLFNLVVWVGQSDGSQAGFNSTRLNLAAEIETVRIWAGIRYTATAGSALGRFHLLTVEVSDGFFN